MMDLASGFEFVRPWLSTAFLGSILAIIAKLYIDNRRLRLQETERAHDFQLEVSADGRSNLQFIIDNLVRDIASQREATAAAMEAHSRCETELRGAYSEVRRIGKHLDGVQRQFINYQLTVARAIPPGDRSPEINVMLTRLETLASGSPTELAADAESVGETAPQPSDKPGT